MLGINTLCNKKNREPDTLWHKFTNTAAVISGWENIHLILS